MADGGGGYALAWTLTAAASVSTLCGALGALLCLQRKPAGPPPRLLAVMLGLAGGTMLYVAVAELFAKSEEAFGEAGDDEKAAKLHATLSFFAGALLTLGAHSVTHILAGSCCAADGGAAAPAHAAAAQVELEMADAHGRGTSTMAAHGHAHGPDAHVAPAGGLHRASVGTTLAVALHNAPEGLAAFLATLASARSGLGIAFGVILHNVPEGLCIAAPLYADSRSRARALGWAAFAGVSELVGGAAGYAIARAAEGAAAGGDAGGAAVRARVFGAMFGLVCGMAVVVVGVDFLPAALAHDRAAGSSLAPGAFVAGMALIASTLVLEQY